MGLSLADLTDEELSELSVACELSEKLFRVSLHIAREMEYRHSVECSEERRLMKMLGEETKEASRRHANIQRILKRVTS